MPCAGQGASVCAGSVDNFLVRCGFLEVCMTLDLNCLSDRSLCHAQSMPPADAPGTWTDFFATVGRLSSLQSLAVTGFHKFNGTLFPTVAVPAATVCDLAQTSLGYLKIAYAFEGKLAALTGSLPGCLSDNQSQIRTLHIGALPPALAAKACTLLVKFLHPRRHVLCI